MGKIDIVPENLAGKLDRACGEPGKDAKQGRGTSSKPTADIRLAM